MPTSAHLDACTAPAAKPPSAPCSLTGSIVAVSCSASHNFSKEVCSSINLLKGLGVEGDSHSGATVQHIYDAKRKPGAANLRQVHLMHAELFDEMASAGFKLGPGQIGENVTTRGIDLLGLPEGAKLRLGSSAVVEITGLRSPCHLIDKFQKGLQGAVMPKGEDGKRVLKSGIMGIVLEGGSVNTGDQVQVELPAGPFKKLKPL